MFYLKTYHKPHALVLWKDDEDPIFVCVDTVLSGDSYSFLKTGYRARKDIVFFYAIVAVKIFQTREEALIQAALEIL